MWGRRALVFGTFDQPHTLVEQFPILVGLGLGCPRLPMVPTLLEVRLTPQMTFSAAPAGAEETRGVHSLDLGHSWLGLV